MKTYHFILPILIGILSIRGYAIIAGSYSADEHTLHLYHFDGNANDAVASNALDLILSNATVTAASYSTFGTALDTFTGGNTAIAYSDEKLVSTYFTGADGAFTFEAMIRPFVAITAIPNHMEIISGDDEDASRGWQFRITTAGQLEFNNLSAGGNQFLAALPTAGAHAYEAGTWYHVAVTYNGQQGTAGNLKFYWTKLEAETGTAIELASFQMSGDINPNYAPDFAVGNEARNDPGENFEGLIDEVRISSIARGPDDMLFTSNPYIPAFVAHPADVIAKQPQSAQLTAVFQSPLIPSVRWFKADSHGDIEILPSEPEITVTITYDISSSTYTTILRLSTVSMADSGMYYCIASNAQAQAKSNSAQLQVLGMTAHWSLDLADFSANTYLDLVGGHHAQATGFPVFTAGADGKPSGAVLIDSQNGWAQTEAFDPTLGTRTMTISFWVNWQNPNGNAEDLWMKSSTAENDITVTDGIRADDQWHHICAVFDGTLGRVYADGVRIAEGPWPMPQNTTALLNIGSSLDGSQPLAAAMDDLRIYNYPMTDTEVADVYYAISTKGVCILDFTSAFDLTGPDGRPDCRVDLLDFAFVAQGWLDMYNTPDLSGLAADWLSCKLYPTCSQ
jgi:hypothetical protein